MKGGEGRREEGGGRRERVASRVFFLFLLSLKVVIVDWALLGTVLVVCAQFTRRARGWKESRDPPTRKKDHSAVYAQLSESLC